MLVADDDLENRAMMATLVRHFGYHCDEACDAHEACNLMRRRHYHVVVADINMPGNCSLEMLDAADELAPGVPFILITGSTSREPAVKAVGTQVVAYLEKPVAVGDLRSAISKALGKGSPPQCLFKSHPAGDDRAAVISKGAETVEESPLSPRERQIVQLLAEGNTNRQVAEALGISVRTAETHSTNIMRKMRFSSIADLVRYAIRNKIIEP